MAKYYRDTPEGRIPFTPEQEAQRDAEIAAWESKSSFRKSSKIRSKRNKLLQESDWTVLSDVTFSDEWKSYRQELRDITLQPTFPDEVTWPTKPQ